MEIDTGDWIRITPLWPGIWNVYRVLAGFNENRWSLNEPLRRSEHTLVFCHRLVSDSWKRSFSHQCCDFSYVRPLDGDDRRQLDLLLSSDDKLRIAFEKYQTAHDVIDLVANISFGGMPDRSLNGFSDLCNQMLARRIGVGMTIDEVLGALREVGLDKYQRALPRQVTLQLVSVNHELRDDEFVYRRYRALTS
jgi:hypothetical protein